MADSTTNDAESTSFLIFYSFLQKVFIYTPFRNAGSEASGNEGKLPSSVEPHPSDS